MPDSRYPSGESANTGPAADSSPDREYSRGDESSTPPAKGQQADDIQPDEKEVDQPQEEQSQGGRQQVERRERPQEEQPHESGINHKSSSGDIPGGNGQEPSDSGANAADGNAAGLPAKNEVTDPKEENEPGTMGLLDHLNELRSRLAKACIAVVIGFAICWIYVDPLFDLLIKPLLDVLPEGTHAQYTTLPEAFFTRMHIALVAGIFLASPAIFYQIWAFVAPGLYDEEKRHILPVAFLSAIFFTGGAIFCYFIVFPFAFQFFISFSTPDIVITPKASDYLSFTIKLLFAFGLIFEMPIFTFFLARLGILTANTMRKGRKYAIVAIFIIAAILTPPDVLSQVLMALPMILLYEVSIGVAAVFGKKSRAAKTGTEKKEGEEKART